MDDDQVLEGGCAYGSIRYRVTVFPKEAGFCHCRICQKTTGAPLIAWAIAAIDTFEYTRGEPRVYQSSPWGERRFCPTCGAQLEYRESDSPRFVELNYATLDFPAAIQPSLAYLVFLRTSWACGQRRLAEARRRRLDRCINTDAAVEATSLHDDPTRQLHKHRLSPDIIIITDRRFLMHAVH